MKRRTDGSEMVEDTVRRRGGLESGDEEGRFGLLEELLAGELGSEKEEEVVVDAGVIVEKVFHKVHEGVGDADEGAEDARHDPLGMGVRLHAGVSMEHGQEQGERGAVAVGARSRGEGAHPLQAAAAAER